jgi:succinate dehydrogenase hydrophobic anchor subunit
MTEEKSRLYFKEQHKKDVIWQIWVPVIFGAVAMLSLGLLAIFSLQTGTDASARWGHVATIWLLLPGFVVLLMALIVLAALIFGVIKLTAILPDYSAIVQTYARILSARVKNLADRSVRPVIQTRSISAAGKRFWLAIRYLFLGGYSDHK